ncbi:MAG: DUF402 domain-containing protein [Rhodoglobus sp.]
MASTATLRWLYESRVESAHPCLVIEDSEQAIALFEPSGALGAHTLRAKGGPRGRNLVAGDTTPGFAASGWFGDGVLRVHRQGQDWSVWRWPNVDGTWSKNWYVNLEEPWKRTAIGFDTEDWILDLIVLHDFAVVRKDEDEFEWAEQCGRFDAEHIARIRRAAADATTAVHARAWPFDADWSAWLPPVGAPLPTLLDGWDLPV